MTPDRVSRWVTEHPLDAIHVDCATAVMLKILDGKCKMSAEEKGVMTLLYDQVKTSHGELFGGELHELIARARHHADDDMRDRIYERRVLAETVISRPVMKAFKARIREQGLFEVDLGLAPTRTIPKVE